MARADRPNVVFVFADQWRAQAAGYAGDPNVRTPNLDRLSRESVRFTTAVANCPVCSPYRASLITGQYPLTHGVFLNDVHLAHRVPSIADAFKAAGCDTAYVGKWHLDGRGRYAFVPPQDRQGFDFWRGMECTHRYNESPYYADTAEMQTWDGYDAEAQTRCLQDYITSHSRERPFFAVLSWGPPHSPYGTAPRRFREMYDADEIQLRPDVPESAADKARRDLAGYYAHCSALDECLGNLLATLDEAGLADDTLVVFTSDHGDMHGSHGGWRKQWPYDESILVPFLLRWPARLGRDAREVRAPFGAVDVMPTLLGLCGIDIPATVEGDDFSAHLAAGQPAPSDAALVACYHPFGEWSRQRGGREYRGLRTERHTYVRSLDGPWLLFDNETDPDQLDNLCGKPAHAETQAALDTRLNAMLAEQGDEFLPADAYLEKWGYEVDEHGAAPYGPWPG
ncbi:MAG: sulfatase [Planctomycetota bacterium]